jgi:Ca2+-binding RTX toxin-like protein
LSKNVENLTLRGGAAIDATGNTAANKLTGNAANNVITGGKGTDLMTGKAGADTFDFNSIADSRVGSAHDTINDFHHLEDIIDLSTIDANGSAAGDGVFDLLATDGAAFTGVAGELRFQTSGKTTIIEGDIDGDKTADFQILLKGAIGLTIDDFVL